MSLRDTIARLEKQGDLVRVRREVDRTFELAAVAKKLDGGPAVLFENVRGTSMPVIVGTDGTKDRVARNLGIKPVELIEHRSCCSSATCATTLAERCRGGAKPCCVR
jgi:UbiD family decarboxylase